MSNLELENMIGFIRLVTNKDLNGGAKITLLNLKIEDVMEIRKHLMSENDPYNDDVIKYCDDFIVSERGKRIDEIINP